MERVQLITPQVRNRMNLSLTEVKKHAQWVQSLAVPQTVCIFLTVDGNPLYKEDEIPDHLILFTNGNQWSQAPDMNIYLPCVDTNTWRMWSLSSWEYDYYGLNCVLAKIRVLKSSPQLPQRVTISVDSIFKEIINLKELHWDVPYSKQHSVLIRRGNMDAHREERQREAPHRPRTEVCSRTPERPTLPTLRHCSPGLQTGRSKLLLFRLPRLFRESIPRQVDKKSGGPQGESSLEFSRRRKGQTFFLSLHFLGLYNKNVSCLRTVSGKNLRLILLS